MLDRIRKHEMCNASGTYQEYARVVIDMQKTKLFESFLRNYEESVQEI